jgi:dTDP-4-dehydrorhamnose reductase
MLNTNQSLEVWADERLHTLRKLNIKPIVGLVHHGSGPYGFSEVATPIPMPLALSGSVE